jgi:predicted HNH restriction endonuclease
MGKKLPYTPRSRIRAALRQLFLRSRERAACLKAAGNRCAECGKKASKARGREVKVQVHHCKGVMRGWESLIDSIYDELLCSPDLMVVLCKECHKMEHSKHVDKEAVNEI